MVESAIATVLKKYLKKYMYRLHYVSMVDIKK